MRNIKDVTVYDVKEFSDVFGKLEFTAEDTEPRHFKPSVLNKFMTFDIETTSMPDIGLGFMYVWTACFDGVMFSGRTWEEYQELISQIEIRLPYNTVCVCYCHSLQFEFQFLRNFFNVTKVFAREKRNVISATAGKIEYRCSYMLTNMSLKKFLETTPGVTHYKQSGEEFNYYVNRYPDTELTDSEFYYCVCDTMGLWEALKAKIALDDDTLSTVPLTSTGYVRRDFREQCRNDRRHMQRFHNLQLTKHMYLMCKQAGRGGIAGTNAILADQTLTNVKSYDIKSSYPYQMMTKYFPASKFEPVMPKFANRCPDDYLDEYCCLLTVKFEKVECTGLGVIPYIPKAKCMHIENGLFGNGKVYGARNVILSCTEIDLQIILEQYNVTGMEILELNIAERGMLSVAFRELLHDMFQQKTDLEDGDPYLYMKFKNKINAAYGMMLTDILRGEIEYTQFTNEPWTQKKVNPFDMDNSLNAYYHNDTSFLSYQDGIWVLAHARKQLFEGMTYVGNDIVQVDTDSVKFIHPLREHDAAFEHMNMQIIAQSDNYEVPPYAIKNGMRHFLGLWEYEGEYPQFKTLGAKKYCYYDNKGKFHITVAGLAKQKAADWIEANGGMEKGFEIGTVVPPEYSGRTSSLYNDVEFPQKYDVNGHIVTIGSNVCVKPVEYTFGVTGEWMELIMAGEISEDADML